jgi:anti-sigma B factor antagonist
MSDSAINTHKLPDGIVVLQLKGHFSDVSYDQLNHAVEECFDNKFYRIIVDMSEVDYINSCAAGILMGAVSIAQENRGNVVVITPGAKPAIKEILDLLGLSQMLPVTDNMASAIKIILETR